MEPGEKQVEKIKTYYKSIIYEKFYVLKDTNIKHGPYICYFNNDLGIISEQGNYINGKKNGIWKEYYDNGKLSMKGNYVDDEKEGLWIHFNNSDG